MTVKVLQVLGRSAGGIARHVGQVVEGLGDRAPLALDIAGPAELTARFARPVIDVDIPNGLLGHRRAVRELRGIIGSGGYSVVHAHGLRAGLDSALAGRDLAPVLVTLHNLVKPETSGAMTPLFRRAERSLICRAAHTFVVSRDMEQQLGLAAPRCAGRLETLHAAIGDPPRVVRDRQSVRSELGTPLGSDLIVTVTRLAPQKALPVMLEAFARLRREAVLAIVGEGPLESKLRDKATSLGVSSRVRFMGFRTDAPDLIAAADVFCLSSTWEAVALAAQEAVLLGVPVVATRVGGLVELIEDGISGRLVPSGEPAALSAALEDLLSNPERASAFAAEARRRVAASFSRAVMLDRLEVAYLEAAGA